MKLISVVTGCFNEEDNVDELYARIRQQFANLPAYDYEHIFIDNASNDGTVARIKAIAAQDKRVRLIVNTRNFGHIRSPIHALLQARGDAVIAMASDLQEPPELIPDFIERWEQGYRVVAGVKPSSAHTTAMTLVRPVVGGSHSTAPSSCRWGPNVSQRNRQFSKRWRFTVDDLTPRPYTLPLVNAEGEPT